MKKSTFLFFACFASLFASAQSRWETDLLDTTWHDNVYAHFETADHRHLFHFGVQQPGQAEFYKYSLLLDEKGEPLALDSAAQLIQSVSGPYFFPLAGATARQLGFWETPDSAWLHNTVVEANFFHQWQGKLTVPFAGVTMMDGDSSVVVARDDDCGMRFFKMKLDGQMIWQKTVTETDLGTCAGYLTSVSLLPVGDGWLAACMIRDFLPNGYYFYLVRLDAGGNLIWKKRIVQTANSTPDLALSGGDIFYLLNGKLVKLDSLGGQVWVKNTSSLLPQNYVATDLATAPGGSLWLTGSTPSSVGVGNVFLAKLDTAGTRLWLQNYGRANQRERGFEVRPTSDGGCLLLARRYFSTTNDVPADVFLIKTDPDGNSASNSVRGKIFLDENQNCAHDPGELTLPEMPVKAEQNGGGVHLRASDAQGFFEFPFTEGTGILSLRNLNPYLETCWNSTTYQLSQHDTFHFDFPLRPLVACPLLRVSVAAAPIKPCWENNLVVRCRNVGTADEDSATLRLQLDPALTFVAANLPSENPAPGTFEFALGGLAKGESKELKIVCLSTCDSLASDSVCVVATAEPHDFCLDHPLFQARPPHREETCLPFSDTLLAGSKHPLAGFGEFVWRDSTLRYLLHFQNVGDEILETAVVTDSLSNLFDPMTVQLGASSHPCRFELLETRKLRFTFEGLSLPPASVDEAGSHGFVSFLVEPQPGLARNTILKNTARVQLDGAPAQGVAPVSQKVKFPQHVTEVWLEICTGETYLGLQVTKDTTYVRTWQQTNFDSVLISHITALPSYHFEVDSTVLPGFVHLGVPIFSDLIFVEEYFTAAGCDSIITTNFYVPSAAGEGIETRGAQVFPNPFSGSFFIENAVAAGDLEQVRAVDALGRQVDFSLEKKAANGGGELLEVVANGWQSGVYFLWFKSAVFRLVKL